jgi:hypothetical protein
LGDSSFEKKPAYIKICLTYLYLFDGRRICAKLEEILGGKIPGVTITFWLFT